MSKMQPLMWTCFPRKEFLLEKLELMRDLNLLSIFCKLRALSLFSLSAWLPTLTASSCIRLDSLFFSATWQETQFLTTTNLTFFLYLLIFPPGQISAPPSLRPQLNHSLSVGSSEVQIFKYLYQVGKTNKYQIYYSTVWYLYVPTLSVCSWWRWQWWDMYWRDKMSQCS